MIITIEIPDDKLEFVGEAYGLERSMFPSNAAAVAALRAQIIERVKAPVVCYKQALAAQTAEQATEITER